MCLLKQRSPTGNHPTKRDTARSEAANLRSAISRAYYAAFWRSRAQYLLDGEYISRMDAHQTLINAFRNSRYRNRMAIGAHLIRLRAERNDADYESNVVLAALDHLDT